MQIQIWYMRPDYFSDGIVGSTNLIDVNNLNKTHILLQNNKIACPDGYTDNDILNEYYLAFQGENWSPNGEANNLIESKGLGHTSMSVGDIIAIDDRVYVCKSIGWKLLGEFHGLPDNACDNYGTQLS